MAVCQHGCMTVWPYAGMAARMNGRNLLCTLHFHFYSPHTAGERLQREEGALASAVATAGRDDREYDSD